MKRLLLTLGLLLAAAILTAASMPCATMTTAPGIHGSQCVITGMDATGCSCPGCTGTCSCNGTCNGGSGCSGDGCPGCGGGCGGSGNGSGNGGGCGGNGGCGCGMLLSPGFHYFRTMLAVMFGF